MGDDHPRAGDAAGTEAADPDTAVAKRQADTADHDATVARQPAGAAVTKQQWRARLLAARRGRTADERAVARERITAHLLAWLTGPPSGPAHAPAPVAVVCAYHPLPSEPLAADLPALLARAGIRVLVPAATKGAALDWCELSGPTRRGMLGVAEPIGPRLGPAAIRDADVVLVPALAVDRDGIRLGRGGGHYDRSLALCHADQGSRPRLVAVVFDDEVVEHLPRDAHDIPVTDVLTPSGGRRHVAPRGPHGASSD